MTEDVIKLITELGFPIALAIGCLGMLAWVIRYILKDKVEDTLQRFDERHDNLLKEEVEMSSLKVFDLVELVNGDWYSNSNVLVENVIKDGVYKVEVEDDCVIKSVEYLNNSNIEYDYIVEGIGYKEYGYEYLSIESKKVV